MREDDTGQYGESLTEAFSELADPMNPAGTYTYVADQPTRNKAEKVALDAQADFREAAGDQAEKAMRGLHWSVRKVPRTPDNDP